MTLNRDTDTTLNRIAVAHAVRAENHREDALHCLDESAIVDAVWAPVYVARAQVHATLAVAEWTAFQAEKHS